MSEEKEKKAAPKKAAKAKTFKVAAGVSICCSPRGILGEGTVVTEKDVKGGKAALTKLADANLLVES